MKTTYSKEDHAVILKAQESLREYVNKPKNVGLCTYLDDTVVGHCLINREKAPAYLIKDTPLYLLKLFKEWPEYSGDVSYPVPVPEDGVGYTPQDAYSKLPRNGGEYGEARIRLAKYLIKRIDRYFSDGMHIPAYMIEPNTIVNMFYTLVVDDKGRYYLDLFGEAKRIPATKRLFVQHMEN